MVQQQNPTVKTSEFEQMEADLEAIRSREQEVYEVADLDMGMDYETWREVYGWQNEPGYSEGYGQY